jgi:hypothetical protein
MPEIDHSNDLVTITEAQLIARIKELEAVVALYQKLLVQIRWNLHEMSGLIGTLEEPRG